MKIYLKTISSLKKVFPDEEPCGYENCGSALLGENYNFQIAYRNEEDHPIFGIDVKAEGDLAKYTSIRKVESVPAQVLPVGLVDDYYLKNNTVGLYPDLLTPIVPPMKLCASRNQWKSIYVTISVPKWFNGGDYENRFIFYDKSGSEIGCVSYNLRVIETQLVETDLKLTNWVHYDCIADYHKVKLFGDDFYKIFDEYLRTYVDIGNNMLYVPLFTPPLDTAVGLERTTAQLVKITETDSGYKFDFSDLDRFINFALEREIKYFELSHLFTQWGGEFCPKIVANTKNGEKRIFGWDDRSDGEKYKNFLSVFLPQLVKFLKEKGVFDKCYFHLTDEPELKDIDSYRKCRDMVKTYIEGRPTMDALSNYEFYRNGLVDVAVPVLSATHRFLNEKHGELFTYYCTPQHPYYTNRSLSMPLLRTRILGVQMYQVGVNGFLHWGYNFYKTQYSVDNIDPYRDTSAGGCFSSGNSFIVYPSESGVYASLRARAIAEGFTDYRALKTLEKLIGKDKVLDFLSKNRIEGFNEYPRNDRVFRLFREKINSIIETIVKS